MRDSLSGFALPWEEIEWRAGGLPQGFAEGSVSQGGPLEPTGSALAGYLTPPPVIRCEASVGRASTRTDW